MLAEPGENRPLLPKPAAPRWGSAPAALLLPLLDRARAAADRLSLRGKFLSSLVLVIVVMTFCTLLAVRQLIEVRAERQLAQDTRNSLLTFQMMSHQQQMALSRKAELLATLALLRDGDETAIREASQDPWQSEDCDLFAATDGAGKLTALQTRGETTVSVTHDAIGKLLRSSNASSPRDSRKPSLGWWVNGNHLYQIVVMPIDPDHRAGRSSAGKVIVGHELDAVRVKEFARILSSDLIFRQGGRVLASSLSPFGEQQFSSFDLPSSDTAQLSVHNKRFFITALKLSAQSPDDLDLLVVKSDDVALASIGRLNLLLVLLGFTAVLLGGLLVYFISSTFTKPLDSLVKGVRALEQGNFSYPLASAGGDELGTVTRAFDSMRGTLQGNEAQRKQLEDELRQSQKMDALGRLAGGVAHDFNNLLTIIKGNSDLALDQIKPADPARANCEQISKVADRAAALTRQLLAFSRRQLLQPRVLDLNDLVMESSRLLKRLLREDIEFNVRCGDSLGRVLADAGQIEQVLLNLTVNAADAMPSGGKLVIETDNVTVDEKYALSHPPLQPGRYVMFTVTDSGSGMTAEIKARIFEPFFTTKEPGKGTGLGLATVYGIVNQSSGCIHVESSPGAGTRFEIYLPHTQEKLPDAHSSDALASQQRHRETVLLVEDESAVRTLTCEFLQAAGYQVLSASDGIEALEIAERLGGAIHILLTDVVMPRMRGPELARLIQQKLPRVIIVFVSGYTEELHSSPSSMDNGFFLQKPFSRDQLLRKLNDAIRSEKSPHSRRSQKLDSVV
jgi:signal transduction histidine kinase/AmiR/NasT family two-component response regulator